MPNEVKLLPCPFCGSKPEESGEWPQLFEHSSDCVTEWSVRCGCCGIELGDEYRETVITAWNHRPTTVVTDEVVERLRGLSFALAAGGSEETDPAKLLDRILWGVDHIQQVEAKRAADLVEELSKTPKTTWGAVKTAILSRAFAGATLASMPTVVTGEQPQSVGDHALPPSGLSQSSLSQAKPAAAIARKGA